MHKNKIKYTLSWKTHKKLAEFTKKKANHLELKIGSDCIKIYTDTKNNFRIYVKVVDIIKVHGFFLKNNIIGKAFCPDDCIDFVLENNYVGILKYLMNEKFFADYNDDDYDEEAIDDFIYSYVFEKACQVSNLETIVSVIDEHKGCLGNSTAFGYICDRNEVEMMESLLDRIIDYCGDLDDFDELLSSAVENNNFEMCKLLIDHGAHVNADMFELLDSSMENGNVKIAKYLLSNGADIDDLTIDDMIMYMENDSVDCIELILKKLNYDKTLVNNLFRKSENSSVQIVKLLIKNGANIKKYGEEVCKKAKKMDNDDLTKYLKKELKKLK